jgi:hypothetical protein
MMKMILQNTENYLPKYTSHSCNFEPSCVDQVMNCIDGLAFRNLAHFSRNPKVHDYGYPILDKLLYSD